METVEKTHLRLTVLIEKDEDGYYVASVPALKSCYTQAKTLEELYPRIREVIDLCMEVLELKSQIKLLPNISQ